MKTFKNFLLLAMLSLTLSGCGSFGEALLTGIGQSFSGGMGGYGSAMGGGAAGYVPSAGTTDYSQDMYGIYQQVVSSAPPIDMTLPPLNTNTQMSFPPLSSAPVSAPVSSGSYSSGSSGGSSSGGSGIPCKLCRGLGKCWTCNGTRKYLNGLTNKYVTCPNCTDGLCSHCHGSKLQ